jgi:hypothetical protein
MKGVAGESLRAVSVDGIAAIVGDLSRRPSASTLNLCRYAIVVESIAERTAATLPVRFGTTFEDSAELMFVLRSRRASIRGRLRAVRGRVQMTVRLFSASKSVDDSRASRRRSAARSRVTVEHSSTRGRQYLRQRLKAFRMAHEIPETTPVRAAVGRLVKDERVEWRSGIATVHHLIPRSAAERYRDAVERAAAESGLRLAVSGPWAPYAFAENW